MNILIQFLLFNMFQWQKELYYTLRFSPMAIEFSMKIARHRIEY